MKYFSIDLETAGIDWNNDTILEFGAILEDTNLQRPFETIPKFNVLLRHPKYTGSPYALAMHTEIFTELAKPAGQSSVRIIDFDKLGNEFMKWIIDINKEHKCVEQENIGQLPLIINVAGKNFGTFDLRFLENLEGFKDYIKIRQRIIDPAVLYFDVDKDLKELPNLSLCKERAGIKDTSIAHRTIKDAWDIIQVLRGKMYPKIGEDAKWLDFKELLYTEKEVEKLLETQRGNCYVAILSKTKNEKIAETAIHTPEPGMWRKK